MVFTLQLDCTLYRHVTQHIARCRPLGREEFSILLNGENCTLLSLHLFRPVSKLEITLLMVLLRNICSFIPPVTVMSTEVNIVRVKCYRNTVYGHAGPASVDDAAFNTCWQDISNAMVALGGASYAAAIKCMDPDTEEHYRELLKQWKKDEDIIKEKLEEMEGMLEF